MQNKIVQATEQWVHGSAIMPHRQPVLTRQPASRSRELLHELQSIQTTIESRQYVALPASANSSAFAIALNESIHTNAVEGSGMNPRIREWLDNGVQHEGLAPSVLATYHDIHRIAEYVRTQARALAMAPTAMAWLHRLQEAHRQCFEHRAEYRPGQWKDRDIVLVRRNQIESVTTVPPYESQVTLIRGWHLLQNAPLGYARGRLAEYLVTAVHPFRDGNGRISRLAGNAELSRAGLQRIITHIDAHSDYIAGLEYIREYCNANRWLEWAECMQRAAATHTWCDSQGKSTEWSARHGWQEHVPLIAPRAERALYTGMTGIRQQDSQGGSMKTPAKLVMDAESLFHLLQETLDELHQADAAGDLHGLPAHASQKPDDDEFVRSFYEAFYSNHIEGSKLSTEEAWQVTAKLPNSPPLPATKTFDALDMENLTAIIRESPVACTLPPTVSEWRTQMQTIHKTLFAGNPDKCPGEFKNIMTTATEVDFIPPYQVAMAISLAHSYCEEAPVGIGRAAMLLAAIVCIHPFSDGNGRLSRLYVNAELTRVGLSRIIMNHDLRAKNIAGIRQLWEHQTIMPLVRTIQESQEWAASITWDDRQRVAEELVKTDRLDPDVVPVQSGNPASDN